VTAGLVAALAVIGAHFAAGEVPLDVQPPTQVEARLTLDEAMRIAQQNAFALRRAESQVVQARHRVAERRGLLAPRVGVEGTYTRFDQEGVATFGEQRVVVQPIDRSEARLTVSLPIDVFGNIRRGVRAAEAQVRASEQLVAVEENELRLQVRDAFFNVLQARAFEGVAVETLASAQARLRDAEIRFDAGTVARVDVLRFATQVSQAQADLIAAQGGVELSKSALNNVLGRPVDTPVEPVEVPLEAAAPVKGIVAADLVQAALLNRRETRAIQEQLGSLELLRQIEARAQQPTFALAGTHTRTFHGAGFGARDASTVGVATLSFPIFDGGISRARARAVREDIRQAEIQLEQVQLGITLQVRQALIQLENAAARLAVAQQQVQLAEEAYRLALVRYQAEEGIQLEVTEAQTELTRARVALVNARYDYLTAYSELQRAVGVDELDRVGAPAAEQRDKK
jgi:outer membrane protein